MSFFELPPEASPPRGRPVLGTPPWSGPPSNVLGELVVDRIVLSRSPTRVVTLEHLRAYPEGFELRVVVRSRSPGGPGVFAWRDVVTDGGLEPGGRVPGPVVRVGLALPGGARLANIAPVIGVGPSPSPPLLVQFGHGGDDGRGRIDLRFWVWGLPGEGPLALVIESPAMAIPETQVALDGSEIRRAAGRAEVLWEAGPTFPAGGFDASSVFAPEPLPTGRAPADPDAARAAIWAAFADLHATDGDELVNVEGGEDLGPTLRTLLERFDVARMAQYTVERVAFLDESEAAVWFSVWLGPSPHLTARRGGARLVAGRWKVSRDTFCALVGNVGIPCPPPP